MTTNRPSILVANSDGALKRRYCLLRIFIGLLALATTLDFYPLLTLHFSSQGWSSPELRGNPTTAALLRALTPTTVKAVFWACEGGLLSFVVGYRARLGGTLGLAGMSILYLRCPLLFDADDELLRATMFVLLFAVQGAHWSLGEQNHPATHPTPAWPLRLIRFRLVWLYLASGMEKLFGHAWRDGTATTIALNNPAYARFLVPASLARLIGPTSTAIPWLEFVLGFLLMLPKTRPAGVVLGLAFHFVLGTMLELRWFTWIVAAHYLAFVSDRWLVLPAPVARRLHFMAR